MTSLFQAIDERPVSGRFLRRGCVGPGWAMAPGLGGGPGRGGTAGGIQIEARLAAAAKFQIDLGQKLTIQ